MVQDDEEESVEPEKGIFPCYLPFCATDLSKSNEIT